MRIKFKYKREHFETQEQFDSYRDRQNQSQKKWLKKHEQSYPEHRERRLLKQRLYSRYHYHTDCRQSFREWLKETFYVEDITEVPIEKLRTLAANRQRPEKQ